MFIKLKLQGGGAHGDLKKVALKSKDVQGLEGQDCVYACFFYIYCWCCSTSTSVGGEVQGVLWDGRCKWHIGFGDFWQTLRWESVEWDCGYPWGWLIRRHQDEGGWGESLCREVARGEVHVLWFDHWKCRNGLQRETVPLRRTMANKKVVVREAKSSDINMSWATLSNATVWNPHLLNPSI